MSSWCSATITRESVELLGASKAMLVVRDTPFGAPLVFSYHVGDAEISVERRPLPAEIASLAVRAGQAGEIVRLTADDSSGA